MTGADMFGDSDGHTANRTCTGNQNVFSDEVKRQGRMNREAEGN